MLNTTNTNRVLTIESPRLLYRPLAEQDATETYASWLNNPAVNQFLETRHSVQTVASCREFIQACNQTPNEHLFGVFLKETEQHIGNTKLGFINPHYQTGQLSLFIGEQNMWGKGFASEVIQAITQYGFEQLQLHKIEAGCYESNLGSLRAFMKNGYVVEGFLRNHVILEGKRQGTFWLGKTIHEHQ